LRPHLLLETTASAGEIERRRTGRMTQPEARFEVEDLRALGLAGLKQIWRYEPPGRYSFETGFDLRQLDSTLQYFNERRLSGAIAPLRARPGEGSTAFRGHFDFDQSGVFVSTRLRAFEGVTAELGARHDWDSLTNEDHLSPRFNLAWTPSPRTAMRLAWGWFYQSHRPNELQVEDDETEFKPAERSEHRVLGFEHRFRSGASLQAEAFERRIHRTRARFENLFTPVAVFPELEQDRVRIEAAGGLEEGLEIAYRSGRNQPLGWWLSYTLSAAKERIDDRLVPRAIDQPHALRAGLTYRAPGGWNLHAVWLAHTGWPITRLSGRLATAADGSAAVEPVLGPLNAERLPPYHRLDLRVSRTWKLARGRLSAYVDLQNLYDRHNVRGLTDVELELDAAGRVEVRSEALSWGGLLPSFSIRWEL
jgi:outer membrane receptor protein involved in Fe transport